VNSLSEQHSGASVVPICPASTASAQVQPASSSRRSEPTSPPFPPRSYFVSWLHLCPRTPISGGKPLNKRRKNLGANRVAGILRMAALSLQRSKTALGAGFRRIARHKGGAVAVFAIARKLAQLVYRTLRYGHTYTDIGEKAYELTFLTRRIVGLKEAARSLGYDLVPSSTEPEVVNR
jgi:hypothetical protein